MKKIRDLIKCEFDIDILGVTDDSRNVKNGYLFVATKGFNEDHFDYIDEFRKSLIYSNKYTIENLKRF